MTPVFNHRATLNFYIIAGLLAMLLTLFVAAYLIERNIELTRQLADDHIPKAILADRLLVEDLRSVVDLRDALSKVGAKRKQLIADSTAHLRSAEAALQELEQTAQLPEGRELVRETQQLRTNFLAARAELLRILGDINLDQPISPHQEPFHTAINAIVDARDRYHNKVDELKSHRQQVVKNTANASVDIAISAQWMLVVAWVLAGSILIVSGFYWRRHLVRNMQLKNTEINKLTSHRDTLVREVHHRIKNHLQGVLGMIEAQQRKLPDRAEDFDALLGHVLSLTAVHGLQAQRVSEEVSIADLVTQQIALYQRSRSVVDLQFDAANTLFMVPAADAVPLTLVITELLINAAKHNSDPAHPRITLCLSQDEKGAHVRIANPTAGCVEFDFAAGKGFGTGLSLVKSMLVDLGELTTHCIENEFVASLWVYPPPPDSRESF